MKEPIYYRFGKKYRRIKRNEKIMIGAMQSWCNGELQPIKNSDGKTIRAMDVLFPRLGEIIGGSQREEDYDKLKSRINELKIPEKELWWYLETRKFGTAPHSGFGLGFERMVQFVTGMSNIRDVIPFPRTPRNAEF